MEIAKRFLATFHALRPCAGMPCKSLPADERLIVSICLEFPGFALQNINEPTKS